MRKAFVMFLLLFSISNFGCSLSSLYAQQKQEVVTADGVKEVDVDQQRKDVKERLDEIKSKRAQEQEEKGESRNTRRAWRLVSKIIIVLVAVGGYALWKKMKAKK